MRSGTPVRPVGRRRHGPGWADAGHGRGSGLGGVVRPPSVSQRAAPQSQSFSITIRASQIRPLAHCSRTISLSAASRAELGARYPAAGCPRATRNSQHSASARNTQHPGRTSMCNCECS